MKTGVSSVIWIWLFVLLLLIADFIALSVVSSGPGGRFVPQNWARPEITKSR